MRIAIGAGTGAWLAAMAMLAAPGPAAASRVQTVYAFDPVKDDSQPMNLVASADGRVFGILAQGPNKGPAAVFELDPPTAGATRWTERTIFTSPAQYGRANKVLLGRNGHLFTTTSNYLGNGRWSGSLWDLSPPASGTTGLTASLRASNPISGGLRIAPFFLFYLNGTNVLFGGAYGYSAATGADMGELIRLAPYSADPTRYLASVLAPSCTSADNQNDDCSTVRSMVPSSDGSLYGNTEVELFRLAPPLTPAGSWTRQTLTTTEAALPHANCPVAEATIQAVDRSQNLYAFGNCGAGFVAKLSPPGWTATILADFTNLSQAASGLAQDRTGLLLVTTSSFAAADHGAVYRLWSQAPTRATPIHVFSGPDGDNPGGLTTAVRADGSRAFFGFTNYGGTGWTGAKYTGAGTVFQVDP